MQENNSFEDVQCRNDALLQLFQSDLVNEKDQSIDIDIKGAKFYVDTYLQNKRLSVEEGIDYINDCFGKYVVNQCWWSTPVLIRRVSKSVGKFYHSMLRHHIITMREYSSVQDTVEHCVDSWIEDLFRKSK